MLRFFRRLRQNFLVENKTTKYLLYALGEIILIVIGILVALQINNWNEANKERRLEAQLIHLLISDLEGKKQENLSDLNDCIMTIERFKPLIDTWDSKKQIDTTFLKYNVMILGYDFHYLNESSPLYEGVSNTSLFKQLPDSLISQIDNMYRIQFIQAKIVLDKMTEYATYTKLHVLGPNDLVDLNQDIENIHKKVSRIDQAFISRVKLLNATLHILSERLETSASAITNMINNLKAYNASKK